MKKTSISFAAFFLLCPSLIASTDLEARVSQLESRVNVLEGIGVSSTICAGKMDGYVFERQSREVILKDGDWIYKGMGMTANFEFKILKETTAKSGSVILVTKLCRSNADSEPDTYAFAKADVFLY